MALNPKQSDFISYYLVTGNATESAKKSGYSEKTAYAIGAKLLKKVEIKEAIAEAKAKIAEEAKWTREDSVKALKAVIANPDRKSDVTAAIKVLNEMAGYNAPQKIEHSGNINTIKRIVVSEVK